jgi:hypothetical protein
MTGTKGFALVLVGIIVFAGCCFYATELYDRPSAQATTGLESKAWEMLDAIKESEALLTGTGATGVFDHDKVMTVQAQDLDMGDLDGLAFQLEILDISGHEVSYSRSIARDNPIQTAKPPMTVGEGDLVTLHSAAIIQVGPDDAHGARLVLNVWEA